MHTLILLVAICAAVGLGIFLGYKDAKKYSNKHNKGDKK
jgi:hypothetical protein